jgi:hypothetical protein
MSESDSITSIQVNILDKVRSAYNLANLFVGVAALTDFASIGLSFSPDQVTKSQYASYGSLSLYALALAGLGAGIHRATTITDSTPPDELTTDLVEISLVKSQEVLRANLISSVLFALSGEALRHLNIHKDSVFKNDSLILALAAITLITGSYILGHGRKVGLLIPEVLATKDQIKKLKEEKISKRSYITKNRQRFLN